MKLGRTALLLSIFATASLFGKGAINLSNEELLQAYELGHYHGVNQVEREFKQNMGSEDKSIRFKQFMVGIDVSDIPAHKIFLLKNYGFLEGVNPVTLSNNMLIFNSYDRKPDAQYLMDLLNKNYKLDKAEKRVEIIVNNDEAKEYRKAPFIYRGLFENMLESIKSSVQAKVYVDEATAKRLEQQNPREVEMPTRILQRKPVVEQAQPVNPKAVEKSEAQVTQQVPVKQTVVTNAEPVTPKRYFTPKYGKITALTYNAPLMSYKSKEWKESLFVVANTKFDKSEKIGFVSIVTTDQGTRYVKVLDKNLWVDAEDVTLHGEKN